MKQEKPHKLSEAYVYELKYDGTQVRIENKQLITKRGLNRNHRFPHIAEALPETPYVFYGEIVKFEDTNGRCKFPLCSEDYNNTKLVIWDVETKGNYEERRKIIESYVEGNKELMASKVYESYDEAWKEVIDNDLEGLVAKSKTSIFQYDYGIKMKNHEDFDEKIVETIETEGVGTKLVGVKGTKVICYDKEDIETIKTMLGQGKKPTMTIQVLKGTKRNPVYKKIEV